MTDINLEGVKRLSNEVDFNKLAEAIGIKPNTLHKRIKRGSPELSSEERKRLKDYLLELHVQLGLFVLK